ncbi:MAG: hypothetical protein JNK65_09685 [Deltaproteobacteria bacterium]|nr:hypothetical protein [Deltaproteobacteria bacterium]
MFLHSLKDSLISRLSQINTSESLTSIQSQVDRSVSEFTNASTDLKNILPFLAGNFAYSLTRVTLAPLVFRAPQFTHPLSFILGVGAESTAIDLSSYLLQPRAPEQNFYKSWMHQNIQITLMKAALRTSFHPFLQALVTNTGIIIGNEISSTLSFIPKSEKTFSEQFFEASLQQIQYQLSIGALHSFVPSLHLLEKSLQIHLKAFSASKKNLNIHNAFAQEVKFHPAYEAHPFFQNILYSISNQDPRGGDVKISTKGTHTTPHPSSQLPNEILLNGAPISPNDPRLLRLFKLLSRRVTSAEKTLELLCQTPPDYQLDRLYFVEYQDRSILIEGEITFHGWQKVAHFRRMLVRHVDALGAPLVVLGHGVEVDEHHWGNGIGTLIAANDLLFFRSLGVEYFFLPVGNQGQRFWPHLGFDFVSPEMTSQKIKEFIHFLKTKHIELSPDKQRELYSIVHSWELLNFRDESERALGKEFFFECSHTLDESIRFRLLL